MGRFSLRTSVIYALRPVLMLLGGLHRRSLLRGTHITAVVGSFGKTTTTRALRAVRTPELKAQTTRNMESYVALDMLQFLTGTRELVYETAIDRPGRMAGFARMVRPQAVVVTSIGSEHNQSFGDIETTRHEKAMMVRALEPSGLAVLNADDPNVMWMASQTRARVVTFGYNESADVQACAYGSDERGRTRLRVLIDGREFKLRLQLTGPVMGYPALAALAFIRARGEAVEPIIPALEALEPSPGRLEVLRLDNGVNLICDEHKAPLETIEKAFEALAAFPAGRRIVVLGEIHAVMGNPGQAYRHLGAQAAAFAQYLLFVGKRNCLQPLRAGFTSAGRDRSELQHLPAELPDAIKQLADLTRPGDAVLFKGNQRHWLQRLALGVAGRTVACRIDPCNFFVRCAVCPNLEGRYQR